MEDQALGGQAQAEAQIEKVRQSNMDVREKYKSIQEIRSSFASKKSDKSSSLRTILTTSSTMTMGAILVYPLCFKNSGVICGIVVTVIVCYLQWKTCSILLVHIKSEEDDMSITINRIMGKVWKYIFNASAALLFVCAVLIYFLLAANMIYPIVKIFMHFGGVDTSKDSTKIAPKDKIEFGKFSFQYASLIAIVMTLGLINIRDFTFIIKIGNVGFFVLVAYVCFLIYTTIANFVQNDPTSSKFEIFTAQIPYTAGTAALAFLLHPACAPIYNAQAKPENNSRDLKLGYCLSLCLYFCFGIFGYLGIWGKEITTTANTVMDYYTTGVPGLIVDFLYIFKVMTSIPVVFYIATVAVFNLFRKNESDPIKMLHRQIFNTVYLGILLVCGIVNVQPQIVISFTGAFCGYMLGNIIPIAMHWKCLYGRLPFEKKPDDYEDLIDPDTQLIKKPGCLLGANTKKLLVDSDNVGDEEDSLKEQGSNEGYYCDHSKVTKLPRAMRGAYFIGILVISLVIVGAQIYQVIQ